MTSAIRYFEWGDEKPGYVSTWKAGKDGEVMLLGQRKRTSLPKTAVFDCPYN